MQVTDNEWAIKFCRDSLLLNFFKAIDLDESEKNTKTKCELSGRRVIGVFSLSGLYLPILHSDVVLFFRKADNARKKS